MSSPQMSKEPATQKPAAATVDLKLEVIVLPVSDVDRAKRFYEGLGWRLDGDFSDGKGWRVVQLTPPGSGCSIFIGSGITAAVPGSVQGTFLIVDDLKAARADLVARGADVSDAFHFDGGLHVDGTKGRVLGPDPQDRSYFTFASFSDPDGNSWMLQEIKNRLPGRGVSHFDVRTMTDLLKEAEEHHGEYEATAPKHHWSGYYAGYIVARQDGKTPEEAAKEGIRQIESGRK